MPDALLVHDVGLTGLVGRKGSTGIRAAPRMEGVRHSILSNWMLRTRVDRGSVDCVNRVGEVQTGQDADEFLLVDQRLWRRYCDWVARGIVDSLDGRTSPGCSAVNLTRALHRGLDEQAKGSEMTREATYCETRGYLACLRPSGFP